MARLILIVTWMCVTGVAMAAPNRMTGDDIQRAMKPGALLEIDTPLRISIPVKVSTDGIVSANAGALGLTLGAQKDRGRWWTDGDKLCMKWFRWFDAKPRCMVLLREGNRVHWQEGSGESGTATLTEANPIIAVSDTEPPATAPTQPASTQPSPPPHAAPSRPTQAPEAAAIAAPVPARAEAVPQPAMRFASLALSEVIKAVKPIDEPPVSMLGGPPPSDDSPDEPSAAAPSPPLPEESNAQPAVAPAESAAMSKSVSKRLFHVAGVQDDDELTLRSGPSEDNSAVGGVSAVGRNIEIIGECRDGWCPVRHGTDVGWVNRRYLVADRLTREASFNRD